AAPTCASGRATSPRRPRWRPRSPRSRPTCRRSAASSTPQGCSMTRQSPRWSGSEPRPSCGPRLPAAGICIGSRAISISICSCSSRPRRRFSDRRDRRSTPGRTRGSTPSRPIAGARDSRLSASTGARGAAAGGAGTMDAKFVTRIRENGFEPLAPDAGTGALEAILRSGRPQVAVLPVSWGRLLARYPTPPRLLEDVAPERAGARRAAITSRDELQAGDPETRPARLRALLEDELVRALQLGAHARIEGDHDFARLGLDSLLALDL